MKIYNETRATVISLYQRLQKHMKQEDIEDDDDEVDNDPDFFHIEDDENMNEEFLYVVKKSLIIDEWKKRRQQMEKKNRLAIKNSRGVNTIGNLMAASFKRQIQKQNSSVVLKKQGKENERDSIWGLRNSSNNPKQGGGSQNKPKDLTNHLKVVFLDALKKNA